MTKAPYKAPIRWKCADSFHPEPLKAAVLPRAVSRADIGATSASCMEYRYAAHRAGAVWSEPAGQDLPCLLSIFPDIFVASSCERRAHPTSVSHRRSLAVRPLCPIILSFSIHGCVPETSPTGSRGDNHSLHTSVRSRNAASARLRVISTGSPARKHPHSGYVHALSPVSETDGALECNSAPVRQESAAATVNTAMGVFHLRCEKLFSR